MILKDFECRDCGTVVEEMVESTERSILCEACGGVMDPCIRMPMHMTTVVPSYPGCKAHKAGYVHTHGDRPATKVTGRGF